MALLVSHYSPTEQWSAMSATRGRVVIGITPGTTGAFEDTVLPAIPQKPYGQHGPTFAYPYAPANKLSACGLGSPNNQIWPTNTFIAKRRKKNLIQTGRWKVVMT